MAANDVNALISGNYLQQPSPFSWAQANIQNANANNALLQRFMEDAAARQFEAKAIADRQSENNSAALDRGLQVANVNNKGAMDRTVVSNQPVITGDGIKAVPTQLFRVMTPRQLSQWQQQYEQVATNKSGSVVYYKLKGAKSGGNAPANPASARPE